MENTNVINYKAFLVLGGFACAALQAVGFDKPLLDVITVAGSLAGGLLISQVIDYKLNPNADIKNNLFYHRLGYDYEPNLKRSAFFALGGATLTAVASMLPFAQIVQQATNTIAMTGMLGVAGLGLEKLRNNKVKP